MSESMQFLTTYHLSILQYFMYKLRNTTSTLDYDDPDNQTELQLTFESYLSVAAMLPGVLFMFLNTVATKL